MQGILIPLDMQFANHKVKLKLIEGFERSVRSASEASLLSREFFIFLIIEIKY